MGGVKKKADTTENRDPNSTNPRVQHLTAQAEGVTPRDTNYGQKPDGVADGKHACNNACSSQRSVR